MINIENPNKPNLLFRPLIAICDYQLLNVQSFKNSTRFSFECTLFSFMSCQLCLHSKAFEHRKIYTYSQPILTTRQTPNFRDVSRYSAKNYTATESMVYLQAQYIKYLAARLTAYTGRLDVTVPKKKQYLMTICISIDTQM